MNIEELKSSLEEKGFLSSFVEETGYTMFEGKKFDIYVNEKSISIITHEQVILGIEEPIVDVTNKFETEEEFINKFLSSHFKDDDDVSDVLGIDVVKPQPPIYFQFLNILKMERPTLENTNYLTFKIKNNGWIWVDNSDTNIQISKTWHDESDFYQAISSICSKQENTPSPYAYDLSFSFLNKGNIVRVYSLITKELVSINDSKIANKRIGFVDFKSVIAPLEFFRTESENGDSFVKLYYNNAKQKSGFPLYVMFEEKIYY